MLPVMLEAAEMLKSDDPTIATVIAATEAVPQAVYTHVMGDSTAQLSVGKTPEILCAADFVITSSGTATVEAAYFKQPMVVVYKTGGLTYQIARRLIRLDNISMVNIIAGRKVVPELIQQDATAEKIASAAQATLYDDARKAAMVHNLVQVRESLGGGGVGPAAFQAIQERVPLC